MKQVMKILGRVSSFSRLLVGLGRETCHDHSLVVTAQVAEPVNVVYVLTQKLHSATSTFIKSTVICSIMRQGMVNYAFPVVL